MERPQIPARHRNLWPELVKGYLLYVKDPQKLRFYVLARSLAGVTFSEVVPEEKRGKAAEMLGSALLEGMRKVPRST